MLVTFLAAVIPLAVACNSSTPSNIDDDDSQNEGGAGAVGSDEAPPLTLRDRDILDSRPRDYNEALRTASLKLVRALPTLEQIKNVAGAQDQKAAYEAELDKMLDDVRFQERMIKWWQDVMLMGGGAQDGNPSRDTAPIFAARVVATGAPYTDLFTATNNTCPTYDYNAHAFVDGNCNNGVQTHAGVLSNPGVMYQFYGNMAFRRVRWVQELFVCTKFPAEYSQKPVNMGGSADYTSPWSFNSVPTGPIDFQDTSSVVCANCHTTINHIAPLFANFDAKGAYQNSIQVMTPTAPDPVKTELSHWLMPGEGTYWRLNEPVADLPALGKAMAADPDIPECAAARFWNFTMSKEDIVNDLATVPLSVLKPYIDEFKANGMNVKKMIRSMFTSEDFVRF